jgi:hypothetical protein
MNPKIGIGVRYGNNGIFFMGRFSHNGRIHVGPTILH